MRVRLRLSLVIHMLLIMLWCDMASAVSEDLVSPSLSLSVENQRLTVHIQQVSLREVLETLIEQVPITVTIKGFEGKNPISATFTDLPFIEGVERLLQGQDYALLYQRTDSGSRSSGQAQLAEIFVLPRHNPSSSTTLHETQLVLSPEKLTARHLKKMRGVFWNGLSAAP